jgi:ADP-ribose pyrophosphatase YjhB (NUDIX family)
VGVNRHGEGAGHVTGTWSIPAGRIDDGETARQAAVRDLAEETGVRVDAEALIELPHPYEATVRRKVDLARISMHAFATQVYEGSATATSEGVPSWVPLDDVPTLEPLLPNTAEVVRDAVRALGLT